VREGFNVKVSGTHGSGGWCPQQHMFIHAGSRVTRLVRAVPGLQACRFQACWQVAVSVARVLDDSWSALPLSSIACNRMPQVLADGYREDKDGLIYRDYNEGSGETPSDGQEVRSVYHHAADQTPVWLLLHGNPDKPRDRSSG
jgi:hypothetical protein